MKFNLLYEPFSFYVANSDDLKCFIFDQVVLLADPVFLTASSQQLKNRKRHSICGSIDNSEGTNPVTVSKKRESVLVPNEENRGSSQEIIFSGTATETWLCQPAIYSFSTAGGCHKS